MAIMMMTHYHSSMQAESELRAAQADFDKQVEITKLLMEGLSAIQINHLKHLNDFVQVSPCSLLTRTTPWNTLHLTSSYRLRWRTTRSATGSCRSWRKT